MKLPITEKEYKEAIWNYNASVILSFLTGLAIALAAQQSVQLTASGVGMLAFLAGFGVCWFTINRQNGGN